MWPFSNRAPPPEPSTVDRLVFAVGDVHGRSDLLDLMLERIVGDALDHLELKPVVVFLGDYVDRGSDSAGTIERLVYLSGWSEAELVCLRGNHEDTLLRFLEDASVGPTWATYGGATTLQSYGVPAPRVTADFEDWEEARLRLKAAMPAAHLRFLLDLPLTAAFGDYLFVHAGVRPGVALDMQDEQDLLWIRGPFLRARQACDLVVVHGHTPEREVHLGPHRIGVDTGAYATGVLSAVRLCGAEREVVQVSGG